MKKVLKGMLDRGGGWPDQASVSKAKLLFNELRFVPCRSLAHAKIPQLGEAKPSTRGMCLGSPQCVSTLVCQMHLPFGPIN